MKLSRDDHGKFVNALDSTAEKFPLLWLPCVLLLAVILGAEDAAEKLRNGQKPFCVRAAAAITAMAFAFAFFPMSGLTADAAHVHNYGAEWHYDSSSHWRECECGEQTDLAAHIENGGAVTIKPTAATDGIMTYRCSVCGCFLRTEVIPALGEDHVHSYGSDWVSNSTGHWHQCGCGQKADIAAHTEGGGVVTVQPDADKEGVMTFYCTVCGRTLRTEPIPKTESGPDTNDTDAAQTPQTDKTAENNSGTENDTTVTLQCELSGMTAGKARFYSKSKFFSGPATIMVSNTDEADALAEGIMAQSGANYAYYAMDITVYGSDGSPMELADDAYIRFELPLPANMADSQMIGVCHVENGTPTAVESEIFTDDSGVRKIRFTAEEFSVYMIIARDVYDVSSGAAAEDSGTPIDMTVPTASGMTVPEIKPHPVNRYSTGRRRYRILRRRRLDDLVFVY